MDFERQTHDIREMRRRNRALAGALAAAALSMVAALFMVGVVVVTVDLAETNAVLAGRPSMVHRS